MIWFPAVVGGRCHAVESGQYILSILYAGFGMTGLWLAVTFK